MARGDLIVKSSEIPNQSNEISAKICWMDTSELIEGTKFIVQHNTNQILTKIQKIEHVISTDFSSEKEANTLKLNDIGEIQLKLSKPLFYDSYKKSKSNGPFILINPKTNATSGVGFIN